MTGRADPVIVAEAVGKRYVKYVDTPTLVGGLAARLRGQRRQQLWAIRGLDLEVHAGECVGIIGRNGSGKSTLLRMLAGVTAPTEGRVTVRGRVAPLISVGVGFHPELTGRENVRLNGAILGLSPAEIEGHFDEIVSFADIGEFLDTPVKFYSSGMFVRLGFAVSIVARPDVLIVDEVLAVGDFAFQLKCFERMRAIRDQGSTVVVVSHNLNAVRRLCDRTALVHDGAHLGTHATPTAIAEYQRLVTSPIAVGDAIGSDAARIGPVGLGVVGSEAAGFVTAGDVVELGADAEVARRIDDPHLGVMVHDEQGGLVYHDQSVAPPLGVGSHRIGARFVARLPTGTYQATLTLSTLDGVLQQAAVEPASFYVDGRPLVQGHVDLEATIWPTVPESGPRSP